MQTALPTFKKYLFVCENCRDNGACCGLAGQKIRESLKKMAKDMGLSNRIRISRSGCLDVCSEGPSVLLEPEHIWFHHVSENDVRDILIKASAS